MKEKDTIQDYYDKFMNVVNKIRLMGEDLPDSKIIEKLFVSFPERKIQGKTYIFRIFKRYK